MFTLNHRSKIASLVFLFLASIIGSTSVPANAQTNCSIGGVWSGTRTGLPPMSAPTVAPSTFTIIEGTSGNISGSYSVGPYSNGFIENGSLRLRARNGNQLSLWQDVPGYPGGTFVTFTVNGCSISGRDEVNGQPNVYFSSYDLTQIVCPVSPLTAITNPAAQAFEAQNGNVVDTQNLAPSMLVAYTYMQVAVNNAGGQLRLNSAYRPPAYQLHLREVWDKWLQLNAGNQAVCQNVRSQVQAEMTRHTLIAQPAGANGFHTRGAALDINFGTTGLPVQTIINLANQSGLYRRMPVNDHVHFEVTPQLNQPVNSVGEVGEEIDIPTFNTATNNPSDLASSVSVKVSEKTVGGRSVYSYRVINNSPRLIISANIGYDSLASVSQLLVPPLNWDLNTGIPAGSSTSPTGWNIRLTTTEESEFHYLAWRVNDLGKSIMPGQTLSGFSVTLPQADNTYLNSKVTVVFEDGTLVSIPVVRENTSNDFDGDGKADISVFRPSNSVWYLLRSNSGFTASQFGISTDKITPADFDGDGKTDIAVYRSGTWYLQRSTAGFTGIAFGDGNDVPQPADFDGDGKAEIAVWRPSNGTWYVLNLVNNQFNALQFGTSTDKPVVADYDGDGKADYAVYRPSNGTWYMQRSTAGFTGVQFGDSADKPVAADYDGDGKTDVAVFRPSNGVWYLLQSTAGFRAVAFGLGTDSPTPADYDGDGRADISVFRAGYWYRLNSANNAFYAEQFGATTDRPVPSAFVP